MWYLPQLIERIKSLLGGEFPVSTELPDNQAAWLAVPVFGVAKQQGRDVAEVATEVAEKLQTLENVSVEVSGGFVNIHPTNVSEVLNQAGDPDYPTSKVGDRQKVIVELGGMNIAKPMSVGHLRSTLIGDSLQRIYRSIGADVTSINHLGDWGTQFGKLLVAYQQKYGDLQPRPDLTIKEMLELYVGFHEQVEQDPDLDDQARAMFKRLEDGDPEIRRVWQALVDASLAEFDQIFERLGVTMDEPKMGESHYEQLLPEIIQLAKTTGVAQESDGALIVPVPGEETPLMLVKRDGATVYATRDLAQVKYRVDRYHPDKILYCVGNEQALHFRQYHAVARLIGIAPATVELVHVKFGLVRLPEGKMSTRKGRVVFLEDVMDEAVKRAKAIVESKNPDLDEREKSEISEVVGIGAIKYFDLSHDRRHDIVFDWDRMLSLKGDSAPYLQYSYVRALNILKKAGHGNTPGVNLGTETPGVRETPASSLPPDVLHLIHLLAKFPLVVHSAAEQYTPHTIANYLNSLATEFNKFYENYPVLQSEGEERRLRLAIVSGVANVLRRGLSLLGIQVLDRM